MDNERKYFISVNGSNLGPLKFDEISERLANSLLTPDDYVFVVGSKDWRFIKDIDDFKDYVKPLIEPETNKVLFIHKGKQNLGPFSTIEVTKMLDSGQIDINDYCWKKGTNSWVTLKDTGAFSVEQTLHKEQKTEPAEMKSSLEMIKSPDSDRYVKPTKKRILPELILGLILFCVGILELRTNELLGGLIAFSGLIVIIVFLRVRKK